MGSQGGAGGRKEGDRRLKDRRRWGRWGLWVGAGGGRGAGGDVGRGRCGAELVGEEVVWAKGVGRGNRGAASGKRQWKLETGSDHVANGNGDAAQGRLGLQSGEDRRVHEALSMLLVAWRMYFWHSPRATVRRRRRNPGRGCLGFFPGVTGGRAG